MTVWRHGSIFRKVGCRNRMNHWKIRTMKGVSNIDIQVACEGICKFTLTL